MKQSSTFVKLGLALVGQALPNAAALEGHVKAGQHALAYTIVASILSAALLMSALYGLHLYLLMEGVSFALSVILPITFAVLALIICLQRSAYHARRAAEVSETLSLFEARDGASLMESLLLSFMDGLQSQQEKPTSHKQEAESAHEKIILVKD